MNKVDGDGGVLSRRLCRASDGRISVPQLSASTYYFQVTDPSGKILLSIYDASCRPVQVDFVGAIYGFGACHPDALTDEFPLESNGADRVALPPHRLLSSHPSLNPVTAWVPPSPPVPGE